MVNPEVYIKLSFPGSEADHCDTLGPSFALNLECFASPGPSQKPSLLGGCSNHIAPWTGDPSIFILFLVHLFLSFVFKMVVQPLLYIWFPLFWFSLEMERP